MLQKLPHIFKIRINPISLSLIDEAIIKELFNFYAEANNF